VVVWEGGGIDMNCPKCGYKLDDKFTQLVEDLKSGKLTFLHIQNAIRVSVRESKNIPDEVKDLLCGKGDAYSGLIFHMFKPIGQAIGTVELAYRRGVQK